MRRLFTYANVVSLIVIVLSFAGTATAARLFNGTQIKDGTITSADVKTGTLGTRDFATTTLSIMRGATGATGGTGLAGGLGSQGLTGDQGKSGEAGHSLIRYATYWSDLIKSNPAGGTTNPHLAQWYAEDGASAGLYPPYTGSGVLRPNLNESVPTALSPIDISFNEPPLVELSGSNHQTTGTIKPRGKGLLNATATLTVLHQNHAMPSFYTGGRSLHGRIRCRLRFADNGAAIGAGSTTLGSPEWLSSFQTNKLYTITISGSEPINADLDTNYNVGVSCTDVDQTNSTQWVFVGGSVTAHAIWVGPK